MNDFSEPQIAAPVFGYGTVTTVFDPAWELFKAGQLPVWGSVLAESQTQGRGRGGHVWQSPKGHVYAALRLPDEPPFNGSAASVSLALALALALEELFDLKVMIKWPNDLMLAGKKVGGLLLEARQGAVIGGIGLNLLTPPAEARAGDQVLTTKDGGQVLKSPSAGALPISWKPERLWPQLVEKTRLCYNFKMASHFHSPIGNEKIIKMAADRLLGLDQTVTVHTPSTEPPFPDQDLIGVLIGLDSTGALLIERDQSIFAVWSGSLFF
jgi:biotin-(acetyl-CoA carboxylase) ligase